MTATQKQKLIVPGFVVSMAVLLLMGLGAYRQGMQNVETEQWVRHTFEVLGELDATLSLMQDVETGARGFIITGQDLFLEPFNSSAQRVTEKIHSVRRLTEDNPEQQRRLDVLEPLVVRRINISKKQIDLRRTAGKAEAEEDVGTGEGKRVMDGIRQAIAEMQTAENQLLQNRTDNLRASNTQTLAFFVILVTLLGGLLLASLLLVRQNLEAQQRELELTEKARAYAENIVNTVREPLLVLDSKFRVLSANRSFYQTFRMTPPETERKLLYGLGGGQWNIPELRQLLERILPEHTEIHDFAVDREFPGIGRRSLRLNARKIYRVGNNTETILLAIEDLTERKRAAEERDRFFELSPDLICIAGFDGYFKYVNPAWETTLGFTSEELLARRFLEFVHPEDRESTAAEAVKLSEGKDTVFFRNRYRCKDGSYRWFSWNAKASVANDLTYAIARDVTDMKLAQDEIQETRDFLDALVENVPTMIFVKDAADLRFVRVNRACEELLGYSRQELIGKSDHDFFPRTESDFFTAKDREVLQSGVAQEIPREEVRTKRGDTRILHTKKVPLLYGDGQPQYLLGISEDITELVKAQEALRRSHSALQNKFEAAIRTSGQLLYEWDARTNASVYGNVEASLGYTEEEMAGGLAHWIDLIHPEDRNAFQREVDRSVQTGTSFHLEYRVRRKGGDYIHVEDRGYLTRSEDGTVTGTIGFVADISERKSMELALRTSEEKFAKAFRSSPMAIMISSLEDGRLVEVNDGFCRMTGYGREEAVGKTALQLDLYADPADRERAMTMLREKGYFREMQANFRAKNGETRCGLGAAELIQLNGLHCLISVVMDVTEQKKLEEQFRQAQKMEAVGRLAGGIAHDFNNLLGVIIGFSDLLRDRLKDNEAAIKYVIEIRKAGDRAASLTRQLLAFSRKQVLEPRVLDLNAIISDQGKMLHRLIGEDIKLVTVAAPDLGQVKADPGQIEQVVLNLVVNARDAMPKGGKLTIETANVVLDESYARAHVAVVPGPYVMVAVSDTGTGMDADTRVRIFEPFFTTKGHGTGLGLATVYGIVKQSGGNIWVYSEVGRGTTFKIYLPRVDAKPDVRGVESSPEVVTGGSETILLVEDSDSLRAVSREFLERAGYKILEAPDGNEAVRIAREYKSRIDLLLTDVVMPGMSGRDVAEQVKLCHTETKVLYMSGYTDDAIVQHGVLEEGVALLSKPFAGGSLVRKVRQILDS